MKLNLSTVQANSLADNMVSSGAIITVLVNVALAIPTILSNLFVLVAVVQTTQLHTPSHVLIWNLALADLGVGVFTQPTFIISTITSKPLQSLINLFILIFGGISLVGVILIQCDRYIALLLHLRYLVVITTRKTIVMVFSLWIAALIFIPLIVYKLSHQLIVLIGSISALICLIESIYIYYSMYKIIKRHRNQIRAQSMTGNSTEIAQKGRAKSIKTSVWVQFIFILCWLPLVVVAILKRTLITNFGKETFAHLFRFSMTVFMSKSLANPILYCYRVENIRRAVLKASRRFGKVCYQRRKSQTVSVLSKKDTRCT